MTVTAAAEPTHAFQMHDHLSVDMSMGTDKPAQRGKEIGMYAEEEPSFWDFLDVINPLQHIPVVNTIYRDLTGDQIGVGARLAGGTLFGGPIGFLAAAVNTAIEEESGKDIGGHLLAMLGGGEDAPVADTKVASAAPPASPAPAPGPAAAAAEALEPEQMFEPAKVAATMPANPTMMFTADGLVPTPGSPAPGARPLPVAGGAPARFMPVPPRNPGITAVNSPPPVSVPIANSGTRSNVPITGRDPVASTGPGPLSLVEPQAKPGGQAEWFGSAMKTGLDKYEQAAKLARRPDGGATVPLQ